MISRAYWDKHTEQWNLKKRCVKTRVSKTVLQCNQEGTLNYGARVLFFFCVFFVPVSINRIIFSIFIQLLLVSSSLPDCFPLSRGFSLLSGSLQWTLPRGSQRFPPGHWKSPTAVVRVTGHCFLMDLRLSFDFSRIHIS